MSPCTVDIFAQKGQEHSNLCCAFGNFYTFKMGHQVDLLMDDSEQWDAHRREPYPPCGTNCPRRPKMPMLSESQSQKFDSRYILRKMG